MKTNASGLNIQEVARDTYQFIFKYIQEFSDFKSVNFGKKETENSITQTFFYHEDYPVKLELYPDHFQTEGNFKPCYTIRARAGFPDVKLPRFVSNVLNEVASEKYVWGTLSQHRKKVLNLVAKEHKLEIHSSREYYMLEKIIAQLSEDSIPVKMEYVLKNLDAFIYGLGNWYHADPSSGSGSWHVGNPIL